MAGFNMMDLMNGASKSQTAKPSYELMELPIGKLIPNPANAYSMDGIEELANSILIAGRVLQNLVVKPADENGNYMIISGHRRHLASKMLVEQGHSEFATVSALVENERNETLQELMLIYTNSTARVLTDAEKMRQATRATALLKDLKEKGQFNGNERIRDAVAKMLNTTTGQIGRYQAIANNLKNEDLKEKFESGEMGVSAAYEASRLSEEGQEKIAEQMKDGKNVSVHDIKQAGGSKENEKLSPEGLPIKEKVLSILQKFKTSITIYTVEKDGKYYAASNVSCRSGDYFGHGSLPSTTRDTAYDSEVSAVEAEIKAVAALKPSLHKALWESGYRIVGEPQREEKEDRPVHTDNAINASQTSQQEAEEALQENQDEPESEQEEQAAGGEPDEDANAPDDYECQQYAVSITRKIIEEKKRRFEELLEEARQGQGNPYMIKKYEATISYMQSLMEVAEKDLAELESVAE